MPQPRDTLRNKSLHILRRSFIFVVGSIVVLAGLAMLVLPGPGWAAIFLGFAILATEFSFAERTRDRLVTQLQRFTKRLRALFSRRNNRQ